MFLPNEWTAVNPETGLEWKMRNPIPKKVHCLFCDAKIASLVRFRIQLHCVLGDSENCAWPMTRTLHNPIAIYYQRIIRILMNTRVPIPRNTEINIAQYREKYNGTYINNSSAHDSDCRSKI